MGAFSAKYELAQQLLAIDLRVHIPHEHITFSYYTFVADGWLETRLIKVNLPVIMLVLECKSTATWARISPLSISAVVLKDIFITARLYERIPAIIVALGLSRSSGHFKLNVNRQLFMILLRNMINTMRLLKS